VLTSGSFELLLHCPYFRPLRARQRVPASGRRGLKWWLLAILGAALPVATFYPVFGWAAALLPPSAWLPQGISNQIVLWALVNGVMAVGMGRLAGGSAKAAAPALLPSLLIALATVAIAYFAVLVASFLFLIDFRFWFVGVKALSLTQLKMVPVYLLPFTVYFLLTLRSLHLGMSVDGDRPVQAYLANAFVLMGGFLLFLLAQYFWLFTTGALLTPDEPLNTIVMIQFVPLLLIVSLISTFCFRRTASPVPGALISGLFVTWYVVAGQATQFALS
jgi:hypothetical protein